MKKVAVVVGLAMVLGAGAAHAGGAQKATGGVSWVTFPAADQTEGDEAHLSFNAHADGPKGQVQVRVVRPSTGELVQRWHGTVDCYHQDGNMVVVRGEVTNLTLGANTNEGRYFLFIAVDNGEGKNAPPDEFGMRRDAAPLECDRVLLTRQQVAGNIQVHG
jgi:hypothetical protein